MDGFARASTPAQAQRELTAIAADLEREFPSFNRGTTLATRLAAAIRPRSAFVQGLLILLGAVGLVLLIGCVNVANLLLARASSRHQEIADPCGVRREPAAAGRADAVRRASCSSVAGGAAGLLVARWLVELPAAVPLAAPSVFVPYATHADQVGIDGVVLAFTLGVSIATGLLFGLVPALRASRPSLYSALAARAHGSGDPTRVRTRQLLVVTEVALALTLLIGAGLLLRSFANLRAIDPGFRADHVLTVDLNLPRSRYGTAGSAGAVLRRAHRARRRACRRSQTVGAVEQLPLSGPQQTSDFRIMGAPPPQPGDEPDAAYVSVTPGYFSALSLTLRRGRVIQATDGAAGTARGGDQRGDGAGASGLTRTRSASASRSAIEALRFDSTRRATDARLRGLGARDRGRRRGRARVLDRRPGAAAALHPVRAATGLGPDAGGAHERRPDTAHHADSRGSPCARPGSAAVVSDGDVRHRRRVGAATARPDDAACRIRDRRRCCSRPSACTA